MLSMTHFLQVLFIDNVFVKNLKESEYEKTLKFYMQLKEWF